MCNLKKIEIKRSELLNMVKSTGLTSSTTLQRSKELDDLLITHQRKLLNKLKK